MQRLVRLVHQSATKLSCGSSLAQRTCVRTFAAPPSSATMMAEDAKYILGTYARQPIELVKGEGVWVWDADGKKYMDFHSGIAVNSLGHSHAGLAEAIGRQAKKLTHVSNLFFSRPQISLARELIELSGGRFDKVFFCNSGTEANEAAIKFARKYQLEQYRKRDGITGPAAAATFSNTDRPHDKLGLISFELGFHGRSMGALSLTSKLAYRAPFAPLLSDVTMLPYNNESQLSAIGPNTAAVFVEPIQGEGGVHPARPEFLRAIRSKTAEHDALMIVDEVQAGLQRCGAAFAHQHPFFSAGGNIEPDIMTLAKPLAGGLPIGAVLMKQKVADTIFPGEHGSTFSGGPLVCTAARVVVGEMSKPAFQANVQERSKQLIDGLNKIKADLVKSNSDIRIVDVRGLGLLIGVELNKPVKEVVARAGANGLMLITAGDNILRLCPPLIVTKEDIEYALQGIRQAIAPQ